MRSNDIVANTRRAYWRNNEALQRHVSEADFVARGYDVELQSKLASRLGQQPMRRLELPNRWKMPIFREPGEDPFEGDEAA